MALFNLQNVGLNTKYFINSTLRFFTPKIASNLILVIKYNLIVFNLSNFKYSNLPIVCAKILY